MRYRANPAVFLKFILATLYRSGPSGTDEVLPVMSFLLIMRLNVVVKVPGGCQEKQAGHMGIKSL